MKHLLTAAVLSAAVLLVAGCGDKADPLGAPMPGNGNGGLTTYATDVKPILDQNCIRCHSTGNTGAERNGAPPDVNFNTYELAVANSERANIRIQAGTMPPTGGLETAERATFQQWINDGTPRGEI